MKLKMNHCWLLPEGPFPKILNKTVTVQGTSQCINVQIRLTSEDQGQLAVEITPEVDELADSSAEPGDSHVLLGMWQQMVSLRVEPGSMRLGSDVYQQLKSAFYEGYVCAPDKVQQFMRRRIERLILIENADVGERAMALGPYITQSAADDMKELTGEDQICWKTQVGL